MKLLSARITGFQSFTDSGEVEFTDGINLIVGQNNAGKSSLLRALQPRLPDDRHRTPDLWEDVQLPVPHVQLTLSISGKEFYRHMLRLGQSFIPIRTSTQYEEQTEKFLTHNGHIMRLDHWSGNRFTAPYPSHSQFVSSGQGQSFAAVLTPNGGKLNVSWISANHDSLPEVAHLVWEQEMFYFSAERMNIGQSGVTHSTRLSSNADNLPAVLLTLNGDRGDVFQQLVGHLREVFPTVGNLSVRPTSGGSVEVRVWPTEAMARVELSFPLLQSGTGIAQVIAILAAVMTVENAVVIIDEINSFLHPAAVKALLRILQTEYTNHQYIISTHAPEVIGFSNPKAIHLVKRAGYESKITSLNLGEVDAFREVANHLGVSMGDVFAADRIIWVEGPTEELCFPLLYQHSAGQPVPRGTIFTSVMATGDFMAKRRDKELVYQIYSRLSQTAVPLVVAVAFSFDSENLSVAEQQKMVQDSQGAMHFLPRRHIECFLISSSALAAFINERDPRAFGTLSPEVVEAKLIDLAATEKFQVQEWSGDLCNPAWLARVDAANIIADVCAELSEHRVTFNKKDDTLALLQRIQSESPDQLAGLADYVKSLVKAVG